MGRMRIAHRSTESWPGDDVKVFLAHPSALIYSQNYMILEPLGLERVAQAVRRSGHRVRLVDLQVSSRKKYVKGLLDWKPEAVGFSLNYLANVPEVVELAREAKRRLPGSLVFVGGHTASFIARELLACSEGAIDCVIRGEGENTAPRLLQEVPAGRLDQAPGAVFAGGSGPAPTLLPESELDVYRPERDLVPKRRRYFIGELDPCASVEFSRGCPYHCSFCSAWTFYHRTYRKAAPEAVGEELARIAEPNVFVVDDVALLDGQHGMAIADEVERRQIRKRYFMETRCDTLIRNEEVFARWKKLGLTYLFLGLEALDDEGLETFHKNVTLSENLRALEIARRLQVIVALNLIVSPRWDETRFRAIERWAQEMPEIVHLTVMMPYPGTETWSAAAPHLITHDYRLFDTQHAVTSTKLPLPRFYEEFTRTQMVLFRKHLNKANLCGALKTILQHLARGRTNFARSVLNFRSLPNARRRHADHFRKAQYLLQLSLDMPPSSPDQPPKGLYVHGRSDRSDG
jgi:hopanoid C-3 methylase HpnR